MTDPHAHQDETEGERHSPTSLRAAGVVHDVNQMLAVIRVRAELLARQASAAEQTHLQAIVLAAQDAGRMLGRLGGPDDAGSESPGAPGDADTQSPASLARASADAIRLVLPPDGRWGSAPGEPGGWCLQNRIDPTHGATVPEAVLREVLVNLISNALAAMPDGGVIVLDSAVAAGAVSLHVRDSGPGLSDGGVEQVFRPGFTTSGRAGRGIGLAACRQLLAAHDATLTAEARGGPGAVFSITAPAIALPAQGAGSGQAAVVGPAFGPATLPRGLAVVVIDDEPAVREMLSDVLAELGCQVACHRDGTTALAAGAPAGASVALVDRRLPGMDGLALAGVLRERQPSLAIVMMTGWDRDAPAPSPGVVDFTLRKPLGMDALQDLLARAAALHERRGRGDAGATGGS